MELNEIKSFVKSHNERLAAYTTTDRINIISLMKLHGLNNDSNVVYRWYKLQERFDIACPPFTEVQLKRFCSLSIDVNVFDNCISPEARVSLDEYKFTKEESLQLLDDLEDILVTLEVFSLTVVN